MTQTAEVHAQSANTKSRRGQVKAPSKPIQKGEGQQNLFTVSPETTYYTAPLDQHGFVRYIPAINQEFAKGVTAENNSVPLYLAAFHPKADSPEHLEKLCKLLEMPVPQFRTYVRGYDDFVRNAGVLRFSQNEIIERGAWEKSQNELVTKPWKAIDNPLAKEFLDQYQPTFELLKQASAKSHYWYPYVGGEEADEIYFVDSILLPHIQEMRYFSRALNIKIMLELGEGNYQVAKDDLIVARRLALHVSQGGSIIEQLVGIACHNTVFNAEIEFLNRCPEPKLLQEYASDIEKLPKSRGMYDSMDKMDRIVALDIINTMARHDFGVITPEQFKNFLQSESEFNNAIFLIKFDWDVASREINRTYDRLLSITKLERKERILAEKQFEEEMLSFRENFTQVDWLFWNLMSQKIRSESFTMLLRAALLPALAKVKVAEEKSHVKHQMTLLSIQINLFKHEHGKYPTELNQLTHKYLAEIQQDIFAAAPFKYSSDGKNYTLYSIGPNGIDNGGQYSESNSEIIDDIIVKSN